MSRARPRVVKRVIDARCQGQRMTSEYEVGAAQLSARLRGVRIRGWQFGDPARALELALAGGGIDIPLAAFGFEIGEP